MSKMKNVVRFVTGIPLLVPMFIAVSVYAILVVVEKIRHPRPNE